MAISASTFFNTPPIDITASTTTSSAINTVIATGATNDYIAVQLVATCSANSILSFQVSPDNTTWATVSYHYSSPLTTINWTRNPTGVNASTALSSFIFSVTGFKFFRVIQTGAGTVTLTGTTVSLKNFQTLEDQTTLLKGSVVKTDRSVTIAAANVAQTLIPANPNRMGWEVTNKSAFIVFINEIATATGGNSDYPLMPNETYRPTAVTTTAISVICSQAGAVLSCFEWNLPTANNASLFVAGATPGGQNTAANSYPVVPANNYTESIPLQYVAVNSGTGYTAQDVISHTIKTNGGVVSNTWFNHTQQTTFATPSNATITADFKLLNNGDDLFVTAAAASASGNNLLLTTVGNGALDTRSNTLGIRYRSMVVQLTCSAALTGGSVTFEGSHNNINFTSISAIDLAYEWTNLSYGTISYPFGGPTANFRSFKIPLDFRFIRIRAISTLTGGTITATYSLSPEPLNSTNVGTLPSASQLLTTNSTAVTNNTTLIAAPATGLRIYFCGAIITDGGTGGTVADCWLGSTGQPGGMRVGTYSRTASSPESVAIYPPSPVPVAVGSQLDLYLNNGTINLWITVFYFIAP